MKAACLQVWLLAWYEEREDASVEKFGLLKYTSMTYYGSASGCHVTIICHYCCVECTSVDIHQCVFTDVDIHCRFRLRLVLHWLKQGSSVNDCWCDTFEVRRWFTERRFTHTCDFVLLLLECWIHLGWHVQVFFDGDKHLIGRTKIYVITYLCFAFVQFIYGNETISKGLLTCKPNPCTIHIEKCLHPKRVTHKEGMIRPRVTYLHVSLHIFSSALPLGSCMTSCILCHC